MSEPEAKPPFDPQKLSEALEQQEHDEDAENADRVRQEVDQTERLAEVLDPDGN